MSLKATENNPNPVPFYIKVEAIPDDDEHFNRKDFYNVPQMLTVCCEHEKKLEEFKIESNRNLQVALKTKTEEIRALHLENKRLLEVEKILTNEIYILKRQLRMQLREVKSSRSEEDNYSYYKKFKSADEQFRNRNKKVK